MKASHATGSNSLYVLRVSYLSKKFIPLRREGWKMHIFMMVLVSMVAGAPVAHAKGIELKSDKLHKELSTDLIAITKEHPTTQPKIYGAIDRAGKIRDAVKTTSTKRRAYKKQLREAESRVQQLYEEIAKLKSSLVKAKKHIDTVSSQLTAKQQEADILVKQKDQLTEKNSQLEAQVNHASHQSSIQVPGILQPQLKG